MEKRVQIWHGEECVDTKKMVTIWRSCRYEEDGVDMKKMV